jgi:hypothetical protein
MPKAKRWRRYRRRIAEQGKQPLSLPALGTLVYGGAYSLLAIFLLVTWSPKHFSTELAAASSLLATRLCIVHAGWLALLIANLLANRPSIGNLFGRQRLGEWFALLVAATLLASSFSIAAAIPESSEIPKERIYGLHYDPTQQVWTVESVHTEDAWGPFQ